MPRRRKLPPDTRPDWRDPNLKIWIGHLKCWVDPETMQRAAQKGVQNPYLPTYDRDPTYNLRRSK